MQSAHCKGLTVVVVVSMPVGDPAGGGDDLSAAPLDGVVADGRVQDLHLDVADGLVAQGPLSRAPLEALHHTVLQQVNG